MNEGRFPQDSSRSDASRPAFGQWPESCWRDPQIAWDEARHIAAGVDVGSVSSQAVLVADGRVLAYASLRTGYGSADSAHRVLGRAVAAVPGLDPARLGAVVGTGYGRVHVPMARRTVSEIACHARGARFMYGPEVRTVLDVGGQDMKAVHCDGQGKVVNFILNDKCAAGTGRGLEVFAELLRVPLVQIGDLSFASAGQEAPAIANTCVVYAKTEALGLLRHGHPLEAVLAAYCRAAAERIAALLERLGVQPGLAVTGGVAKNRGVVERLEALIGIRRLASPWDPQIAGALGAALFAHALCLRDKK